MLHLRKITRCNLSQVCLHSRSMIAVYHTHRDVTANLDSNARCLTIANKIRVQQLLYEF